MALQGHDPHGEPLPTDAYVFGNEIGQRLLDVKTAWRATRERAGITDLHLHDLRREAGSRWLDGGVPIHTVRDWLGHANVSQTSTYLAGTAKTSHDAMRRFELVRASGAGWSRAQHLSGESRTTGDSPLVPSLERATQ